MFSKAKLMFLLLFLWNSFAKSENLIYLVFLLAGDEHEFLNTGNKIKQAAP